MRTLVFLLGMLSSLSHAQVPFERYECLNWRCIGPFRGGRTVGIDGVWNQPNVLYIGVNNGGVWRTTDFGHTWTPIFDEQPTGSIGCLAVAQSDPKTIYVCSGEGLQRPDLSVGDGVYKTTDGGKHWVNTGLRDGQQMSGIAVDSKNSNRVFVAVLGHPYGPNEERGLYRTLDGGKKWVKVLGKDANTGAVAVIIDPKSPKIVYAALWSARQAPWENGTWQGKTSGLFKSIDGGDHWQQLTSGLPTANQGLGRIGFTISPANPNRIWATVDAQIGAGIYRSDDAGKSWKLVNKEGRIIGRGSDFAEVRADPKNPDIVYAANTSCYRSTDGGMNFTCIKGSPGGDDYHTIWIHPDNPNLIGLAADQGACISVNGGDTWSSWYNQPTAQMYHVSTDNAFPYNVYGGQQESGSACVSSRGPDGQITFRDWRPVDAEEYAYVAADPLDPDIVYGSKGSKYNKRTGRTTDIHPKIPGLRYLRTMPMLFSPDNRTLFLASNRLLKTMDGGVTWTAISPDLSREKWDVPVAFGAVSDQGKSMNRRGVIYAVSASPVDTQTIWAGTDDGLVWVTRDGGANWKNVTPPGVTSWSKVAQIDAGYTVNGEAYVAVNRLRCDDLKPYIYVTTNFGETWELRTDGLPNAPVNAVRADPKKPGLLFAATELQVHFSTDSGRHWMPLRMNMPATSIRDLVVKDNDLVIGTHGRSFWIMDSINLLRNISYSLSTPSIGYLVEWNLNSDTPLPPEEPAGKNPPDGVPIDYYLDKFSSQITLEIRDSSGKIIRQFSSKDTPLVLDPKAITVDPRWARPPSDLSGKKGAHRFVWDMRTESKNKGLSMAAIWGDTPVSRGELVAPGHYTITLRADSKEWKSSIELREDPRLKK